MNFSGNLNHLDWTSESTIENNKTISWKRTGSTQSTRSNTSGEQSPDRFTSDTLSDNDFNDLNNFEIE